MLHVGRSIARAAGLGVLTLGVALAGCTSSSPTPSAVDPRSAAASAALLPSSSQPASPSASASASPGEGTETSVFDIAAGDCFTAGDTEVVTVLVVGCEQPHVHEVFAVFDHEAGPDAEYPGDEAMGQDADSACQARFETYVGRSYADSIWFITTISPTAETWAQGDREIVCTLTNEEETEVTGSAEGSEQ